MSSGLEDHGQERRDRPSEIELTLTEDGFIVKLGPEVYSLLGYDARELDDASFFSLLPPDEQKKCSWILEQVVKLQQPVRLGLRLSKKTGGCYYTEAVIGPHDGGIGLFVRLRVQGESEPLFSNVQSYSDESWLETHRLLFDAAYEGVLICKDDDSSWEILSANAAAGRLTGLSVEDLTGKTPCDLVAPEYRDMMQALASEAGETVRELEVQRPDGERVWVQARSGYLETPGARHRVCTLWDMREEKAIREKLQSREEEFKALSEHSPDLIVRYNRNQERIYVNPAFAQMMKIPREEILGKTPKETGIVTGELEKLETLIEEVFDSGENRETVFEPYHEKDTEYFHTRLVPEFGDDGEVLTVLSVSRAITAQMIAEKALQEKEEEYRLFMDSFHGIAFMGDGSFSPLFLRGSVEKIIGYPAKEFLSGKITWRDVIHPDDFDALWEKILRDRALPEQLHTQTYRIVRKDGRIRWVEQHIRYMLDEECHLMRTHGSIYDITERREMAQSLETSQKRYQMLLESISDVVYVLDRENRLVYISPSVENMSGFTPEEMIGHSVIDFIWPDDRSMVLANMERKNNGELETTEHRIRTKEGGFRYIRASSRPLKDESLYGRGLFGIMSDIHSERLVRESLAASEVHFRSIINNVPGMFHRIDMIRQIVSYVSDKSEDIIGLAASQIQGASLDDYLNLVEPEDRHRLDTVISQVNHQEGPYQIDYRLRRPDGEIRWVRDQGQGYWENGQLQYVDGIITDITRQKTMEEELRRSEAMFRSLTENVPGAVYRLDLDHDVFVFLTDEFEKITGYPVKMFLGKERERSYDEIMYPEDRDTTLNVYYKAIGEGEIFNHDYRIVRADGSLRWVQGRAKGYYEDGKMQWVVGIITDIQERKEAEARVEYLTFHDRMTGLYNRNFFDVELKRLDVERMLPLSLIIGDVNGLKLVNDSLGHQTGDEMLILIARTIAEACRQEDILCRWGGDEFAILLPQTWTRDALEIMGRINERCAQIKDFPVPVSVSLGTAAKTEADESMDEVIREAEAMMYKSKLTSGKDFHIQLVYALQEYLHVRSDETPEHSVRLRHYGLKMADALGLNAEDKRKLELLADLHDVGKLVVPEDVLIRPGPLTHDERELVEAHCEHGVKIIQSAASLVAVAEEILAHHEWYDGTGYPRGLKGDEIPLLARMFSIVDAYDVMTQGRSYRKALEPDKACAELEKFKGFQFDPELVDVFIRVLKEDGVV